MTTLTVILLLFEPTLIFEAKDGRFGKYGSERAWMTAIA